MPVKSGASHTGAALSSLLIGGVLNSYFTAHASTVAKAVQSIGVTLVEATGLPVSPDVSGLIVVVSVLSFIWGIAYHHGRHSRNE